MRLEFLLKAPVPELLDRVQEECAEVIQAISKMKRFGIHDTHPTYYGGQSNYEHTLEEWSQLALTFNLLKARIDEDNRYPS